MVIFLILAGWVQGDKADCFRSQQKSYKVTILALYSPLPEKKCNLALINCCIKL